MAWETPTKNSSAANPRSETQVTDHQTVQTGTSRSCSEQTQQIFRRELLIDKHHVQKTHRYCTKFKSTTTKIPLKSLFQREPSVL